MLDPLLDPLEKARADRQSLLYSARQRGFQEGFQEAFHEGFQEGRLQALQEGLQECLRVGYQQGTHEKAVEIATALLSMGQPVALVAQVSKLPLAEVEQIAANIA